MRYASLVTINEGQRIMLEYQLRSAHALVLDLRGHRGTAAFDLAGQLFAAPVPSRRWEVPVVAASGPTGVERARWLIYPRRPHFTGRVVVLTSPQAVSAAETLLGILTHQRRVALVGEPTAGTNGNVMSINLPNELRFDYTGMIVRDDDGREFQGTGFAPDILVEPTLAGLRAGRDEVLEAGVAAALR